MHARTALLAQRVRAFVSVRENGDDTWTYVVGKMSPFVRIPIDDLHRLRNEAEGLVRKGLILGRSARSPRGRVFAC